MAAPSLLVTPPHGLAPQSPRVPFTPWIAAVCTALVLGRAACHFPWWPCTLGLPLLLAFQVWCWWAHLAVLWLDCMGPLQQPS